MTDIEYQKLPKFIFDGISFYPASDAAHRLAENCRHGESTYFKVVETRDLKYMRAYFAFIGQIWAYATEAFRTRRCPKSSFYNFLKVMKGDYNVEATVRKKGEREVDLIKYKSISFVGMGQKEFEHYVRTQLAWIYPAFIGQMYEGEAYDKVVAKIEKDCEKLLSKLESGA